MCDRTRCGGTNSSCRSTYGEQTRWPNLPTTVEMDFTGGCCNHKDNLITVQPHCLDPATWPRDPCAAKKSHIRSCNAQIKVVESAIPSVPQGWIEIPPVRIEWPTEMHNCDPRKYHIPGYAGYVPRVKFGHKFGTFSIVSHQALNEFSDGQRGLVARESASAPLIPAGPQTRAAGPVPLRPATSAAV